MISAERTQAIIDAIGESAGQDYILDPEGHQALYRESLPALAAVLGRSSVQVHAKEYATYDTQAGEAQTEYKKYARRARNFTFFTAIVSALLVMIPGVFELFDISKDVREVISPKLVIGLSLLGVVGAGLASIALGQIRSRKLLMGWMERRSKAEELRLLYFDAVTDLEGVAADATEAVLMRLEYFRRYLLEEQKNYYTIRSQQLEKRADMLLGIVAWTTGLVAIINGSISVLSGGGNSTGWTSLAGLALIVQAYSSMRNQQELSEQNQRNAARYEGTRSILARLYGRLDAVREAIANGKHELLPEFVAAVQEPLSNENRQWLKEMDRKNSAIGKLEAELEKVQGE
ncbi:MAG: hypothetical protein AAGI38_05375 [Bacteroidota bacterium]